MITPNDINTESQNDYMSSTWRNAETESSAFWVVRYCQHRDCGWAPFTEGELGIFSREMGHKKAPRRPSR